MTPPAAAAPAVGPGRTGAGSRLAPGVRPARRVSGPARRPSPGGAARRLQRHGGLLLELLAALERLSSHRLIDRLIRGRAWLGLITFALIGIVTLQLALLKLNGAVGRALQHEAVLQRQDASLSIENSELAAADRVQAHAAQMGMEFASSGSLRFLAADPGVDLRRGAAALSAAARSSSAGSEEAPPGGPAAASGSATGAEGARTEAPATEAPGVSAAGAGSEATSEAGSEAHSEAGSEAHSEASSGQASPASEGSPSSGEATPRAAQGPAGPSSTPASPGGGTQAGPSG